jgi:fibronectin-binding autotransporter adhesin
MKPILPARTSGKPHRHPRLQSALGAVCLLGFATGSATLAQTTYYWDGNGANTGAGTSAQVTGTWGSSAFWTTTQAGTTATSLSVLTSIDTAVFTAWDGVPANAPTGGYTVTLNAAQSVAGILIGDSGSPSAGGTPTLAGTGSPGLTIGSGGVTLNGSNGDPTFAASLGTITLAADQTWRVNAPKVWNVTAAVSGNATTGNTRTWTLGYLNGFTNTYAGLISDGIAGGKLALTLNNTNGTVTGGGTQSITGTANSYTGKTTIQRGILQVTSLANAGFNSSLGAATGADSIIDIGSGANRGSLYISASPSASSSDRVINLAGTTGGAVIKNNNANAANTVSLTGGVTNAGGGNKTLTLAGTNLGNNSIGPISDSADLSKTALLKSEAGVWVLSAANSYTGGTTISQGTLAVGLNGNLGANVAGNNILINGGNLLLSAATNYGSNQVITVNSGGIGVGYTPASLPTITDNTGANGGVYGINYSGDGAVTNLSSLYNGNWFLGSFTGGTYTGAGLTAGNGNIYRLGGGGGTLTLQNNVLTGANHLLAGGSGGGNVILTNANTYTGKTTIQNGSLTVSSLNNVAGGSASSSLGAPITIANGTIDLGAGTSAATLVYTGLGETTDRVINFAGTTGTVTLANSGLGNLNFSNAPTFTGLGAKTIVLGASTDVFGGLLGGPILNTSGTTALTKNGLTNSTWTLTGANTYTGVTQINGGVLSASDLVASSTRVNLAGGAANFAILQGAGTITRQLGAGANRLDWGANGGFAAKDGKLVLNLTTNAGVTGGQLVWGSGSFIGTGVTPMVFGSSTSNNQVELLNAINLNTTDAFNRVIYVEKGVGGDSALLSGVISQGTGLGSNNGIVKDGKGTLILGNAGNSYGGATIIRAGTLVAGASSLSGSAGAFGLGTGSINTPTAPSAIQLGEALTGSNGNPTLLIGGAYTVGRAVSINDNGSGNTYALGGSTDNAATFSGAITFSNGSLNNNSFKITQAATTGANALNITGGIVGAANANVKTVNFDNIGAVNVSAVGITDGAGGGRVAVTKTNTGVLTLAAANTYTGTTTISAGTLLLNGSSASATVVNGGVLAGAGTITSSVSVGDGGTLAPGNSPGTLNTGSLSLTGANATIAMEIGGIGAGEYDQINVTGAVNLNDNGRIAITLLSFIPSPTDIFFLVLNDGTDAINGTLFNLAQGETFSSGGYTWQVSYEGDAGSNLFTGGNDLALIAIIPEPATAVLAAFGALALAAHRRRR